MAFSRQLKFSQRLEVEIENEWLRRVIKALLNCPVLVILIGHFEEAGFFGHMLHPESAVFDVTFQLLRIRIAATTLVAILATKTGQWSNSGFAFVVHQIICVVIELRMAILIDHPRKT